MTQFNFYGLLLGLALVGTQAFAIINGEVVLPNQFAAKSTVILLRKSYFATGRGQCTATLIGQDLVLTAAHCLIEEKSGQAYPAQDLFIYFGNSDGINWDPARLYPVSASRPHPNFQLKDPSQPRNDIGVLKIAGMSPAGFVPAAVLVDGQLLQKDASIWLAGFGHTLLYGDPTESKSKILRQFESHIDQPVSSPTGMIKLYSEIYLIGKFKMKPPSTPDHPELKLSGGMAAGDSGGPAYLMVGSKAFVAGIASGYGVGADSQSPYYENVANYSAWLRDAVKALGAQFEH